MSLLRTAIGVYIDRWGVNRRTTLSAIVALNSALGSPMSSRRRSPSQGLPPSGRQSYAACSMSASESLSGTATDEAAAEAADRIGPVLRRQIS